MKPIKRRLFRLKKLQVVFDEITQEDIDTICAPIYHINMFELKLNEMKSTTHL